MLAGGVEGFTGDKDCSAIDGEGHDLGRIGCGWEGKPDIESSSWFVPLHIVWQVLPEGGNHCGGSLLVFMADTCNIAVYLAGTNECIGEHLSETW